MSEQGTSSAKRPFSDPEKAREAALLSAAARRERKALAKGAIAELSNADLTEIVHALAAKAMRGDVAASRELREWLSEARQEDDRPADVLSLLTQEQRDVVEGWLRESD